ncbi:Membrane component of ER protein translocation complex [Klebsormidium nitens]|uniref:Translocation protein SEC62 n=1 Tax=Klebsormidium nitens TaxID=105231 RepID=A0A0U9HLI7_KLENI|nr:Membrane component of ER protein translocation complex [Klebsormidium nitens]|eukprot:GAQ81259.1 Membrane component of ER protein translocation complex [Klebsormidium nitens]
MGAADLKKKGKGKPEVNPLDVFATKVRTHKALESRWAVLQGKEARVEYFRGKDFAEFLKSQSELLTFALENAGVRWMPAPGGMSDVEKIGQALIRAKLLIRCDRLNKTIRPGKKKLSKFPARLVEYQPAVFSEEDGFYAWTFERKMSALQWALSAIVPIFTLSACLFPVFPRIVKVGVLYFCIFLLSFIFGLLLVRAVIFSLSWMLLGKRYWFLPNIFSDDVATIKELFRVLPTKDDEDPPKWTSRILAAFLAAGFVWILARHGPGEDQRKRMSGKVTNTLHEWLEWNPAQISGNVTAAANVTSPNVTEDANLTEGIVDEKVGPGNDSGGEEGLTSKEEVIEDIKGGPRQDEKDPEIDQQRHEL